MEFKTKISRIGENALKDNDQMLVLFGESVTEEIAKISLSQKFVDESMQEKFSLQTGDQVFIGDKKFIVNYAGSLVNENMRSISHVSLIFKKDDNHLESAIYLDGEISPTDIRVGTIITYSDEENG